jgi:hypothetical protein
VLAEAAAAGLPIVAAESAVARESAGPGARVVRAEPADFGAGLNAAGEAGRRPAIATAGSTLGWARSMQSVYAAAQSAVHLAL